DPDEGATPPRGRPRRRHHRDRPRPRNDAGGRPQGGRRCVPPGRPRPLRPAASRRRTRPGAPLSPDAAPGPVALAERGVRGARQNRIAALSAPTDEVLAAFGARLNLDDLPAPIGLLLRRSTDSGRSWSGPQIVRTGTGFEGFGDPSLLTDPTSGRVLLFHSATIFAGFFESSDSLDDADPHAQHADLGISDDGGHSWRHVRLSSTLRASGNAHLTGGERISGLFATSGAGCALTGGPH